MKNRFLKMLNIFLFCCLMSACIQEIDLTITPQPPQLVVNCLFSPDSVFTVYVSKTQAVEDTLECWIDDANITLWENETKLPKFENRGQGIYIFHYYPKHGKHYSIKVCVNGFSDLYAESTVPEDAQIETATVKFNERASDPNNDGSHLRITNVIFQDIDDVENFYEVFNSSQIFMYDPPTDKALVNEGDWDYRPTSFFFSDKIFDGEMYDFSISDPFSPLGGIPDFQIPFRTTSKEYYLYRKTWTRHFYNQNNDVFFDENVIFKGDPVTMYSNIENGYGIFAGYTTQVVDLEYIEE